MSSPTKWNATHMPVICEEIAENHRRLSQGWFGVPVSSKLIEMDARLVREVSAAPMYWVSRDLTALIQHIARSDALPASLRDLLPTPSGLIFWGESPISSPVNSLDEPDVQRPIDGVLWAPRGDGVAFTFLARVPKEQAAKAAGQAISIGRADIARAFRQLTPSPLHECLLNGDGPPPAWLDDSSRWEDRVINLLAATLVVAASDRIAEVTESTETKTQLKRRRSSRRVRATVRVVNMKRAPATGRAHGESEREYQNRWLVSGHIRSQPFGPGRTQRRLQWVAPYIKGPADKPFAAPRPVVHHISKPPARHVPSGEAA